MSGIKESITAILCFCFFCSLQGQVDIRTLHPPLQNWKDMSRQLKQSQQPLLLLVYSNQTYITQTNTFSKIDSVINSYATNRTASLNVRPIEIQSKGEFPYFKYLENLKNPAWLYIHQNGVLINHSQNITTDQQLISFIEDSRKIFDSFQSFPKKDRKKYTQRELKDLIGITVQFKDAEYAAKLIDEYLKKTDTKNISDSQLAEMIEFGRQHPYSKRLKKLILEDKDRSIRLSSRHTINRILQRYILDDLKDKQLLEPYYVWNQYEKDLGYDADSLFRLFIIAFISSNDISRSPEAVEELYDEVFEYLEFYPRSPWSYLDELYNFTISRTTNKEDLEVLLDLISFQIFRDRGYKQLDYKAVILYKLGHKDRALKMIAEINEVALKSGIKYRSLLYALR